MKKSYQRPQIEVVQVEIEGAILTPSPDKNGQPDSFIPMEW